MRSWVDSIVKDCYAVLGLHPSASVSEVKRAFRKKIKELHPDITANQTIRQHDSETAVRRLIDAYNTLSDPARRAEFDQLYAQFSRSGGTDSSSGFNYRSWLVLRNDPESRAKLVFFDLLHGLEDEAVEEYLSQKGSAGFTLSAFFPRDDFMDCAFMLAEELCFREHYYEAFMLLADVIHLEYEKPYFKHFFPEVQLLAREVMRNKLIGFMNDELALDCLESALELGLGKKNDAAALKLMAGCYERIGDRDTARLCLKRALELDPALTGIRDLRKKLEEHTR